MIRYRRIPPAAFLTLLSFVGAWAEDTPSPLEQTRVVLEEGYRVDLRSLLAGMGKTAGVQILLCTGVEGTVVPRMEIDLSLAEFLDRPLVRCGFFLYRDPMSNRIVVSEDLTTFRFPLNEDQTLALHALEGRYRAEPAAATKESALRSAILDRIDAGPICVTSDKRSATLDVPGRELFVRDGRRLRAAYADFLAELARDADGVAVLARRRVRARSEGTKEETPLAARKFSVISEEDLADRSQGAAVRKKRRMATTTRLLEKLLYEAGSVEEAAAEGRVLYPDEAAGTIDVIDTPANLTRIEEYLSHPVHSGGGERRSSSPGPVLVPLEHRTPQDMAAFFR